VRSLAVWLCLAGCGDNIDPIEVDELGAEVTAAACRYYVRCGLAESFDECTRVYTWAPHPDLLAAVDAAVVVYHYEAAGAYVDWLDSLTCDPTDAAHREDHGYGIYTGTKHDGEACTFPTECISHECWLSSSECTEACCVGYCAGDTMPPPGKIGDRCRFAPCAEGYCDGSLCAPLLTEGEQCVSTDQCGLGLNCSSGTCKRLPGVGEACLYDCRELGQRCNGLTYRCEPVLLRGASCYVHDDCSPFYGCSDTTDTCELATLGESCSDASCVLPYRCSAGKCVEPRVLGAACQYDAECASRSCSWENTCTSEACI
jgi:hypothetical protein